MVPKVLEGVDNLRAALSKGDFKNQLSDFENQRRFTFGRVFAFQGCLELL